MPEIEFIQFPTEVIEDAILVCLFFDRRSPKECAGLGFTV